MKGVWGPRTAAHSRSESRAITSTERMQATRACDVFRFLRGGFALQTPEATKHPALDNFARDKVGVDDVAGQLFPKETQATRHR
jgi:hypothetical protein